MTCWASSPLPHRTKIHRTRSPPTFFTSATFLALLGLVLSPGSLAEPYLHSYARRGHTGTLIKDTLHFIGGQGLITPNAPPVQFITSLNLTELVYREVPTTLAIYNHAATSNLTALLDPRIGIAFGQNSPTEVSSEPLQWVDPYTGQVTLANRTSASAGLPTSRTGHSLIQFDNNLWAFGGNSLATTGAVAMADSPSYDLTAKLWTTKTKGIARQGHASSKVGNDRVLSCFGSSTTGSPLEAECVLFTVSTTSFNQVKVIWTNPEDEVFGIWQGLSMVAGVPNREDLYLFGGRNAAGNSFYQDVYKIDTSGLPNSVKATKVNLPPNLPAALIPSPRAEHVAVTVGVLNGIMVVQGGYRVGEMADATPYFFDMKNATWIDNSTFMDLYNSQAVRPEETTPVAVILVGIVVSVSVLGVFVALYIWKGLKADEKARLEANAESPTLSAIGSPSDRERKSRVYPSSGSMEEDHSLANGPFKSTSSLIQADGTQKPKKKYSPGSEAKTFHSNHSNGSKPWVGEPASPGGTTLTENGSMNGYYSSSSGGAGRSNSNGRNNSQQSSRGQGGSGSSSVQSGHQGHEPYYNPRDLYLDDGEDDDSSITISLASESTMSPWAGPVRLSSDLVPPNPRFSRGAISQAHRQLVGHGGNGGWDTMSPGGSSSSREDGEHHRRSVNSMQWVGFDPIELAARPESGVFDPLSTRPNLTVRNASMYGHQPAPRGSFYGSGGNTSDGTDDSFSQTGQFTTPGGRRVSAALAARQQRRSVRSSQDSYQSARASHRTSGNAVSPASSQDAAGEAFVTKVLPIITTKVTKPSMAKVITQRGSRVVVPSSGPLPLGGGSQGDRGAGGLGGFGSETDGMGGGLGLDFSGNGNFTLDGYTSNGGNSSHTGTRGSFNHAPAAQQSRRTSTLNPSYRNPKNTGGQPPVGGNNVRDSTHVVLKMPPPPKKST